MMKSFYTVLASAVLLCSAASAQPGPTKPQPSARAQAAVAFELEMADVIEKQIGTNPWDIEATMEWKTDDDLDLRASGPAQCEIGYDNLVVPSGGMLMEDIVPFCGDGGGPYKETIVYKLGGAVPGIYVIRPQVFSGCGAPTEVTLTVKFGGVEVFKKVFTLEGRGDEREFYVHANRVNTVYGVEVEERGFCAKEGEGGPGVYGS